MPPSNFGGRPARGFAFSAFHPPRRYCASHGYIARGVTRNVRATSSGLSPSCTLRTARIRSAFKAGVVTDNIVAGTRPRRFLLISGGKELWVASELSGEVSIIDRATNG